MYSSGWLQLMCVIKLKDVPLSVCDKIQVKSTNACKEAKSTTNFIYCYVEVEVCYMFHCSLPYAQYILRMTYYF